MTTRMLPCGPAAVVLEVESTEAAIRLAVAIRRAATAGEIDGVIDVVPGAQTVLVTCSSAHEIEAVERCATTEPPALATSIGSLITIETIYDGADLSEIASTLAISEGEVVALHADATYTAAFCGFAPGFTYLTGLHPLLQLPRRASPRPRVPAGSVAIAAQFSGVYPRESPGGWNLLGRTDAVMWDSGRDRPALVEPGDTVRFVSVADA